MKSFHRCDIFMRLIDYRSFTCSLKGHRAETKKGCSPFGLKIRADLN